MNEFLKTLLISLKDEESVVEELIGIDNDIQTTNFSSRLIVDYIRDNISNKKLLNHELNSRVLVLTEGDPILIIKLLNDYGQLIDILFINREYIAINKWLVKKYMDYSNGIIELDIDSSYNKYLSYEGNILVAGSEEYIEGTQNDFEPNLIKIITE